MRGPSPTLLLVLDQQLICAITRLHSLHGFDSARKTRKGVCKDVTGEGP